MIDKFELKIFILFSVNILLWNGVWVWLVFYLVYFTDDDD